MAPQHPAAFEATWLQRTFARWITVTGGSDAGQPSIQNCSDDHLEADRDELAHAVPRELPQSEQSSALRLRRATRMRFLLGLRIALSLCLLSAQGY